MKKEKLEQRAFCKKKILNLLKRKKRGMTSMEIAKTTAIPVDSVKPFLIHLRRDGLISSVAISQRVRTHSWSFVKEITPPAEKLYPDFDEDHSKWCNTKKPVYNPR
jgi:predicted transcriptional regulator